MRKGFARLAFVGVAATVALYAISSTSTNSMNFLSQDDDIAFIQFIAKYGKSYASKSEHSTRAEIFKANFKMIREENMKKPCIALELVMLQHGFKILKVLVGL